MQRQLHAVFSAEDRAILGDLDRVLSLPGIEARLQVPLELHRAAGDPQMPDDTVPASCLALDDGHEVQHLADAIRGHEPGDQHRRVGKVQLLGHVVVGGGPDPEVAAALSIQ